MFDLTTGRRRRIVAASLIGLVSLALAWTGDGVCNLLRFWPSFTAGAAAGSQLHPGINCAGIADKLLVFLPWLGCIPESADNRKRRFIPLVLPAVLIVVFLLIYLVKEVFPRSVFKSSPR